MEGLSKGRLLTLVGRTLKGKNKIREAGSDEWVVLQVESSVMCLKGNAGLLVAPVTGAGDILRNKARWICADNDLDFEVK